MSAPAERIRAAQLISPDVHSVTRFYPFVQISAEDRDAILAENERLQRELGEAATIATAAMLQAHRAEARCSRLEAALREALDAVDTPYPLDIFPERTDEQRDAIFAAMRAVDKYATEWFYAHTARDRGRVARLVAREALTDEATA